MKQDLKIACQNCLLSILETCSVISFLCITVVLGMTMYTVYSRVLTRVTIQKIRFRGIKKWAILSNEYDTSNQTKSNDQNSKFKSEVKNSHEFENESNKLVSS